MWISKTLNYFVFLFYVVSFVLNKQRINMNTLSPSVELKELKIYVDEYLQSDPEAKLIADISEEVKAKSDELIELKAKLQVLEQKRPEISIPYRESIMWCLNVDSTNPYYFLKSKEGLVKCVQYKHKAKLTHKQNNAFGSVLSMLFKEGKIGRITHFDMFFYGLPNMFEKDEFGLLTILKEEYKIHVHQLKQVNI
jgi:hypothetical protein